MTWVVLISQFLLTSTLSFITASNDSRALSDLYVGFIQLFFEILTTKRLTHFQKQKFSSPCLIIQITFFACWTQIKHEINLNSRSIWQAGHSGHLSTLLPEKGCQYRFHKNLVLRSSSIKYTKESTIPLEKEMATHSTILAGEFHGQRSLAGCSLWGCRESDTTEWLIYTRNQRKTEFVN